MTVLDFCGIGAVVLLPPTLPGIWLYVGWTLIVLVALFAILAYWIAPVGAPLLPSEQVARPAPVWCLVGVWLCSVVLLICGLALTVKPIGCARHAILVSAYVPSAAQTWSSRAGEVRAAVADEARRLHQSVVDLAPVRDAVLVELQGVRALDPDRLTKLVPTLVAKRLRAFVGVGTGGDRQRQSLRESELDPVVIETVELAVLMGWRALYPGNRQNLTYLVSDRAETYGWDWDFVARLNFADTVRDASALRVARVRGSSKRPQLNRVVASRVSADGTAASVDALFGGNEGGSVALELQDAAGNTISQKRSVAVPAGTETVTLVTVDFALTTPARPATIVQLPSGTATLEIEGTTVRSLPPPTPDPLRLSLSAPAALTTQLNETIAFITGRTATCSNAGAALGATRHAWVTPLGGRIETGAAAGESDVTVAILTSGALWLIPSAALNPGLPAEQQPIKFLGDRTLADPKLVAERRVDGSVLVLWRREAAGARFDLHRLGFPLGNKLVPRVLADSAAPDPLRGDVQLLSATGEKPEEVFAHRLALDAYAEPIAPLAARLAVDLPGSPDLRHTATAFALDIAALGVLCSAPVPEPEAFYGFWQFVIEEAVRAATPQFAAAPTQLRPSIGAPLIVMQRPMLRRLAISRAELPLMVTFASLGFYIGLVTYGLSRLIGLRQRLSTARSIR